MRKYFNLSLVLILILTATLAGCGGGGGSNPPVPGPSGTVYAAGYYNDGSKSVPCLWTGNNPTPAVLLPAGATNGRVSSIVDVNGTIYCGGYYNDGSKDNPCYWTGNSNQPTKLPLPAEANGGNVEEIIYADGAIYFGGYYYDTNKNDKMPCYWKGSTGNPYPLLPATGTMSGEVNSLVYANGTVYCVESYKESATGSSLLCYWAGNMSKNPIKLSLPADADYGLVYTSIYADGKVYCAGYIDKSGPGSNMFPCYWSVNTTDESSIPNQLLPAGTSGGSSVNSMIYANGTIYCGGSDGTLPSYWTCNSQSPTPFSLPAGISSGEVYSLFYAKGIL